MGRKKWDQAPPAKGASSKQVGPREGQAETLSAQSAGASHGVERVPYLNPDAFSRFISPKNWGQALINDELTTCLCCGEGYGHYVPGLIGSRDWGTAPPY